MELKIKNKYEQECYNKLRADGWFAIKKGWPDFFCLKGDSLLLVEVKPKRSHRLKYFQHLIMTELSKKGIPCYRWSPEGFEEVTEKTPRIPI